MNTDNSLNKGFLSDRLLINFIGASLVLNIFTWVWLSLKLPTDITEIPLHYSALYGFDMFGEPSKMYILPGIGLAILIANFFLAWLLTKTEPVLSRILGAVALLIQVAILVAILLTLSVL